MKKDKKPMPHMAEKDMKGMKKMHKSKVKSAAHKALGGLYQT